jgi:hypothetical protein
MNARGIQVEYIFTLGMGKMLGAKGYVECIWKRLSIHITCIYNYYSMLLDEKCGVVLDYMVSDDLIIAA